MAAETNGKVWILAKAGYDEYTIVGIYTSEELALAARERIEALTSEHDGDQPRRRSMRDSSLSIEEYRLNDTGVEVIVRVRDDGEVKETHVFVGYRSANQNYERTHEGRAATYDDALSKARSESDAARLALASGGTQA